MNQIVRGCCLAFTAVALLFMAGCGSKQEEKFDVKSVKFPGAPKIIQALEKKEYEAVVAGLAEIKAGLTEATKPDYARLLNHVTGVLVLEMGDSEPAKEAYRAISVLETGR